MLTVITEILDIFYHLRPQKSHSLMLNLPVFKHTVEREEPTEMDTLEKATGNPRDLADPAFGSLWISYSIGGRKPPQPGIFVITMSVIKYSRKTVTETKLMSKQYFWGELEPIMVWSKTRHTGNVTKIQNIPSI